MVGNIRSGSGEFSSLFTLNAGLGAHAPAPHFRVRERPVGRAPPDARRRRKGNECERGECMNGLLLAGG